jgi:hypothetical protein
MSGGMTEVLFSDGSTATFHDGGASMHTGFAAISRIRLLTAIQCLRVYIRSEGKMQMTANGAHKAIVNVISPMTGIVYPRSMNGKKAALADAEAALAALEASAVVLRTEAE